MVQDVAGLKSCHSRPRLQDWRIHRRSQVMCPDVPCSDFLYLFKAAPVGARWPAVFMADAAPRAGRAAGAGPSARQSAGGGAKGWPHVSGRITARHQRVAVQTALVVLSQRT